MSIAICGYKKISSVFLSMHIFVISLTVPKKAILRSSFRMKKIYHSVDFNHPALLDTNMFASGGRQLWMGK